MNNVIEADNYNYTKNITKKHINKFENDVKDKIEDISSEFEFVVEFVFDKEKFSEIKQVIANVYDFLDKFSSNLKIVFDGNLKFQIWATTTKVKDYNYYKKIINEKFKNSPYHNLKFVKNKIKLLKINNETGLVSNEIKRKNIMNFKKKQNTLDSVYSKLTKNKFDWEIKKSNTNSGKAKKIVQDYFKFKHDQIHNMYDEDLNYLQDREEENFYRQVRNASFEIIPKARLNSFFLDTHTIRRMDERNVSPPTFIKIINEGKQFQGVISPHKVFIKKEKSPTVIVLDTRSQKFLTVMKKDDFINLEGITLVKFLEQKYKRYAEKEKKITLKELENFKTVEELKNNLNITKVDYDRDDQRIKNYKNVRSIIEEYRKKSILKLKSKSLSQPLVSNPPYVGDMLEYIKNRQQNDPQLMNLITSYLSNKLSKKNVDIEDLKSAFGKYWNTKIVKIKGKLLSIPLSKTWNLNFKTLHSENLSGNSVKESWAKEILQIMEKPIVVLRYKYPDDDTDKYYVLDGSHRYNEANTKNQYRLNPDEDYEKIPVFLVHLEEEDKDIDPEFFDWITNKRIPNGNWS
jgi:hypothetical protein